MQWYTNAWPRRSRRLGGDHLFLNPYAGSHGALIFKRYGRGVLKRDARRIKDGDLVVRRAALLRADDHLADLDEVVFGDNTFRKRYVDFAVGPTLTYVV